ncbi:YkgJ family cysteine cluster protein [Cystobacter ferrugineus]|uniref:Zinc/iron-chelating domain-containing protein n=1 Tax=Cystobacter ferrugineus TaxID=83449 RepID=A0A1L9AZS0_9BACT|nr:YkgJ family cysteine cluster protein [Cystobacter ferrugineus]OJH35501.1 zinc/iron-chelating domain-containing protein [Cystobacter ferrugineus]
MSLSTLCQHCGLCCDGTLFTHVPLQGTEAAPLRALGLPVKEREDGTSVLPQRCAALDGRHCTAYAARPEGCRRYHCQLFSALSEGEVSLPEALAVVDGAHALLAAQGAGRGPEVEAYLDRHFRGRHRR